ncbi:hypothetical protein [Paucibacter soli]|uniref:hypothetical protein n=1 Tax=Paucibacter soli TaxID=3133433 RepID=UPI0030B13D59
MYRCALAALAATSLSLSAQAQVHRQFPAHALRGELMVVQTPEVLLNGQPARLAPGSRIRGSDNLLLLSASLTGQKNTVHYTIDTSGLLKDLWILNDAELANKTWPHSPLEAANWQFDPAAQVWSKP